MPWTVVKSARQGYRRRRGCRFTGLAGVLVDRVAFCALGNDTPTSRRSLAVWLHYAQRSDAPAEIPSTDDALIHTARQERLLPGEGGIDLQGMFSSVAN